MSKTIAVHVRYICLYIYTPSSAKQERDLLYLPNQIRFLIGEEHTTWAKTHQLPARGTKLTNCQGKQQHELSTRT